MRECPAQEAAAGPAAAAFDPSQYMEAMSGVLQNPAFMNMAEQLGSKIMQVPLTVPCVTTDERSVSAERR